MEDLSAIQRELAALRAEVRRIGDVQEITQLVAQYGPDVDSGSAAATAALWVENGVFSVVGGERTFTMEGHADIAAMVTGAGHQALIRDGAAHVLTTPHVVIAGDAATARSYALNIRWDAAADRFRVARVSANAWTFERTPAGWRITERINANLDGAEASRTLLAPPA